MATLMSYGSSTAAYIGVGNDFVNDIYVDVGPNYVYIYGMKLNHNGLIYIIIGILSILFQATPRSGPETPSSAKSKSDPAPTASPPNTPKSSPTAPPTR